MIKHNFNGKRYTITEILQQPQPTTNYNKSFFSIINNKLIKNFKLKIQSFLNYQIQNHPINNQLKNNYDKKKKEKKPQTLITQNYTHRIIPLKTKATINNFEYYEQQSVNLKAQIKEISKIILNQFYNLNSFTYKGKILTKYTKEYYILHSFVSKQRKRKNQVNFREIPQKKIFYKIFKREPYT
eukprot:TRINITY_DN19575_c1_g1_i6.p1 TRINITY_DN19575_c1_g1~~TRINITY_DN19575_c1_g1_i6.p1  ORF type:complete len:184 (+),score=3.19 TRINITY_DN19575_c1_g1_i6:738-1289(+)